MKVPGRSTSVGNENSRAGNQPRAERAAPVGRRTGMAAGARVDPRRIGLLGGHRLHLGTPNRAHPGPPFHIRRLLIPLPTPQLAFQSGTLNDLPKTPHRLLNRLPFPQQNLDQVRSP